MKNSEKIRAFALKVRAANRLQKHGVAAKLLDGNWHRWRDFAASHELAVWSAFKDAEKHGLLETRRTNAKGRGAPFTEYRATPELEKALTWPKEVTRLANAATYATFCALREKWAMSPDNILNKADLRLLDDVEQAAGVQID